MRDFFLELMIHRMANSSLESEPNDYCVNSTDKLPHDIQRFVRGALFDRWTTNRRVFDELRVRWCLGFLLGAGVEKSCIVATVLF